MDTLSTVWQRLRRLAHTAYAPAALSGLLLTLGFPPAHFWLAAWVALVPLYISLVRMGEGGAKKRRVVWRAFGAGWAFGMVLFLVGMLWMLEIGSVPWAILSAIETAPIALQIVLFALLARILPAWLRPVAFAALFCVFEWLRSQTIYAFPWFILSSTQVHALPFLQIVSLTGQWGLGFFIALVNGFFGEALLVRMTDPLADKEPMRYAKYGRCGIGICVVLAIGGQIALDREEARDAPDAQTGLPVSIIQGNITKNDIYSDESKREIADTYRALTTQVVQETAPALVLWPETVVPQMLRTPWLFDQVTQTAQSLQTPLLLGTDDTEARGMKWNAALMITRAGYIGGRYDKEQLVPMGEYFLFREQLGGVYQQYGVPAHDFGFGSRPGTLAVETAGTPAQGVQVGTLICYDDVFSKRARNRVLTGAQFLAVLTSDQTFGTTAGPAQHIEQAAVRAVETRRYLVRAAANGTSQFIAPSGRVQKELPLFVRGTLSGKVGLRSDKTLFVQWGDWWVGVCAALLVGCGAWPFLPRRAVGSAGSTDAKGRAG